MDIPIPIHGPADHRAKRHRFSDRPTRPVPDSAPLSVTEDSEVVVFITTVGNDSVVDGHIRYRDHVRIRVDVERCGSRFKELVLLEPYSIQTPGNYQLSPSQLVLTGTAFCALCRTTQDADLGRRCSPHTFYLPPRKEGVLLSFDESNTRYSQVAVFEIPFRYRKPSHGQLSRCDSESLIISFALTDPHGNVATFQMPTPFRVRTHQRSELHQSIVQPDLEALPQVSSGSGDIDSTVLPPPPPRIVDINPQCGPQYTSQRIFILVENLPRGNGEQYCIRFGNAGTVATSFKSPQGDLVQILECITPITASSGAWIPSLTRLHDPQTPIASSSVHYIFL